MRQCQGAHIVDGRVRLGYKITVAFIFRMLEQQLAALLARFREDASLREKLRGAADFDAALAVVNGAGFDVGKADLLRQQAKRVLELTDQELEDVAGGGNCYVCPLRLTHADKVVGNKDSSSDML